MAPILGAPEISVPSNPSNREDPTTVLTLGSWRNQYHSCVSKRNEYLPVVISVLGAPGKSLRAVLERRD